jgi:hypothetical protein
MGKAEVYRFLWRRTPKNRARVYQKPGFPTALIRSHPKRAFGSGGFLAHILLNLFGFSVPVMPKSNMENL